MFLEIRWARSKRLERRLWSEVMSIKTKKVE
jgi:hypothetical protein